MGRPRTKLVCTIGPASVERVRELVDVGMSVARVNFSHGTPEEHRAAVHAVRAAAHHARRSVAVLVDLPGLKMRLGELAGDEVELEPGTAFELRVGDDAGATEGDAAGAAINHPALAEQLRAGDRVLLADGAAELTVTETGAGIVRTEVVRGGVIRSRAGVNVPSERLTGAALTTADEQGLERALELRADLIGQSFVRSSADVRALRERIPADGPLVVAKIETRAAVDDFEAVARAADGVMIARGDLGVDLPFAEVPLVQKELIRRARRLRRFTIVATQMLESMTSAARPTRAEASDVANAVLDGADALMLSAETAIGAFPVAASRAMLEIAAATETAPMDGDARTAGTPELEAAAGGSPSQQATIDGAARMLGGNPAIDAAWCFTRTGRTAQLLADHHPHQPVVAFTLSPIVARRLAVRRGVLPIVLPATRASAPLVQQMAEAARGHGLLDERVLVLLVTTSIEPDGINRLELQHVA